MDTAFNIVWGIITITFYIAVVILSIPLCILGILDPQFMTMLEVRDINSKL